MPHGVLFRGGEERKIRAGFINHDLLDAVIGLAPNLFYNTNIPACILVLRAKGAKPTARRGTVLFINGDAEYRAGRAQNYLDPEHVEKIVNAYDRFEDIPGFATVVSKKTLEDNNWDLNIRRYADNAPPPEPHDVRAHLQGGVPVVEIDAKRALFAAHGLDPMRLFKPRPGDARYVDFADGITNKTTLRKQLDGDAGMDKRERELAGAVDAWWKKSQKLLSDLPETEALMIARARLLSSFAKAARPVGLLDEFQVAGVIATWWAQVQNDLKGLAAQGFEGLIEAWATSITDALEDDKRRDSPLDHPLVLRLLPAYLATIAEAEARVAELDATIKGTQSSDDDESDDVGDDAQQLSEAQIKALKKDLTAAKKQLKEVNAEFIAHLDDAVEKLDDGAARQLVLAILRDQLDGIVSRYLGAQRQKAIAWFELWWDKYRVQLAGIESAREAAGRKLRGFLQGLAYGV
jgi:type I restriction enzyme M protein